MIGRSVREAMKNVDFAKAIAEIVEIKKEVRAVHDNQAQIIPALISIYEALQALAQAEKVSLPEPRISMEVEDTV